MHKPYWATSTMQNSNTVAVESTFFKRDGKFMVRTDGPDGKFADYRSALPFGVKPLQQYLIAFPGGRYQALSIAWDSRPKAEGGQRWFHLYPKEKMDHTDQLHWTGRYQNWNMECAECHSTNLKKGYDAERTATRRLSTRSMSLASLATALRRTTWREPQAKAPYVPARQGLGQPETHWQSWKFADAASPRIVTSRPMR